MNILCFGDSNTYGYIPGGLGRYNTEQRYTGILQNILGYRFRVAEDGVCGRTAVFEKDSPGKRGIDCIGMAVKQNKPDILVVMLGTNDCKAKFNADAEKITDGMVQLINTAKFIRPQLKVILCAPVFIGYEALGCSNDYSEKSLLVSRRLPDSYRRIAMQNGYSFLDANMAADADPKDGEHMNEESHTRFAKILAEMVIKLLSDYNR